MRERINRLAKGIVDTELPRIAAAPDPIEGSVGADEITKKEFYIFDPDGRFVKGLVYSSNMHVRVPDNAFGGTRCRVQFEVDARHLTEQDKVEGAFYLITNGGEKKLPYSFSVETGQTWRLLGSLKTAEDFAGIARQDPALAARLFDYREFVRAPFMQDARLAALYHGLRGRLNRFAQMEEFLTAAGAKSPVTLRLAAQGVRHENPVRVLTDSFQIAADGWGYVQFEVWSEGDCIELIKKSYTARDFKEGSCEVGYRIVPRRLHAGRNPGRIVIATVRQRLVFEVEVVVSAVKKDEVQPGAKRAWAAYCSLRLEAEIGAGEKALLLDRLTGQLELVCQLRGEDFLLSLCRADLALLSGDRARAGELLSSLRKPAAAVRTGNPAAYCLFQYLTSQTDGRDGIRKNALSTARKLHEQEPANFLYYFVQQRTAQKAGQENPAELLDGLEELFKAGCRSPYLYLEAVRVCGQDPQLPAKLGPFEQQVLNFAAKKGIAGEELVLRACALTSAVKNYSRLLTVTLMRFYETCPKKEVLAAVCGQLIKGNRRGRDCFVWYQKALEAGVSLTRLYEYFLYALPEDYSCLLPKELLLYFSYEKFMDEDSRSVLYVNILNYLDPESPIYRQYARDIEQFTMEQLLQGKISRRTVVLYSHILYREMVDERVARILPAILRASHFRVESEKIRQIVVCYEEVEGETLIPVRDQEAFVPLYSEQPVILFQDDYGNRYADIACTSEPAMTGDRVKELEEACAAVCPSHPMLRLRRMRGLMEKEPLDSAAAAALKRELSGLKVTPLFLKKVMGAIVESFPAPQLKTGNRSEKMDISCLLDFDAALLADADRVRVCELLISQDYVREVWRIVREYGPEGIGTGFQLRLCVRLILKQLFDEDAQLLHLAFSLFSQGQTDTVLLDYLCEYFNGTGGQMYEVLCAGAAQKTELYDLPERLLAQMMFTGETGHIDEVFRLYTKGKSPGKSLVRAYITISSSDYFLKDRSVQPQVFAYLEQLLKSTENKNRVPTIYLMAIAKYYASLPSLTKEQKQAAQAAAGVLLSEGRIFACLKKLSAQITLPDWLTDREIVEYRAVGDREPAFKIRILPDETEFVCRQPHRSYPGIYVWQQLLFEGEEAEYRICEKFDNEERLMAQGSLKAADDGAQDRCRTALNEMSRCLAEGKTTELKERMRRYIKERAVMASLFDLAAGE